MKNLLRKVLGKSKLSFQELYTVLCDCESVINSRPLTYMSENNDDLIPLTPAMFIQDIDKSGVSDIDAVEANDLRRRYKYRLKLKEDLKKRFKFEYLGQLLPMSKTKISKTKLKVGDVVLITSDNQKKMDYHLGRVEELIYGRDGIARVVRLKTAGGRCLRPIQRLCVLEMDENDTIFKEKNQQMKAMKCNSLTKPKKIEEEKIEETKAIVTRYGRIIKPPDRYQEV